MQLEASIFEQSDPSNVGSSFELHWGTCEKLSNDSLTSHKAKLGIKRGGNMSHSLNKLALILGLAAATWGLTSCSKDQDETKKPKFKGFGLVNESRDAVRNRTLRIIGPDAKPIAQAQVLIGEALDTPFISNFLTTDANGSFTAPAAWTTPMVITISAPGFVRATYFGQVPEGQTYQLRVSVPQADYELKGASTGFQIKDKDGLGDFALVMPTMTKEALFAFDMGNFISPLTDKIEIFGQKFDVPTNVILPKQKENYSIVTITLEKPNYRMYFATPGKKRIFTARGQFPFKTVVGELQNKKTFVELINHFTLQGGSLKEVNITAPSQSQDLPVNELVFNQTKQFKSPIFASDEFLLAIPLSTYQNELMPTDLKNVASNTVSKLTIAAGDKPQLLVVVKKTAEQDNLSGGRLTAAIVPFDDGVQPQLLAMLENPEIINPSELRVKLPALPANLKAAASFAVLSKVDATTNEAGVTTEKLARLWEVYSSNWQADIKLPTWPNDTLIAGKKRWEVTLAASPGNKTIDLGPRLLENVTHATHGASDF